MATAAMMHSANSPTLKRSFSPDLVSNPASRGKKFEPYSTGGTSRSASASQLATRADVSGERQRRRVLSGTAPQLRPRMSSMPVQTTSRSYAVPMPSFMSVFGEEANTRGLRDFPDRSKAGNHGEVIRPATSGGILRSSGSNLGPYSTFHHHRDSTSTSGSESTDTSPTTTISTVDSSSMTEPSPGPSPESPHAKISPSSFVPDFRSRRNEAGSLEGGQTHFFELQRPTTPAKKPRNLKNLAVNTSSSLGVGRLISTAALPAATNNEAPVTTTTSAPSSPSFVKPPTPPRRRPSNLGLTIQTPGNSNLPTRLTIPATPSFKRPNTLRHFQSSPSLPLCSPSVSPSGGMQFPPLRSFKPAPHGFAEVPQEDEEEDQEPNFDIPQSREEKPAAYPNGPICIYESGVYLYFEPTAEQARDYDVIINVASEVKNPFIALTETDRPVKFDLEARRAGVDQPKGFIAPKPKDFMVASAAAAEKIADHQNNSPTTPKASQGPEANLPKNTTIIPASDGKPEYIHIPWEHNTDIVPDLFKLVKLIDDRVLQSKRVLVHCQCGVSRSASLIVAYGLYKNPGISVQEAYDAVKRRSKWIGPNMNLIMQLQEFRNGLLRANGDRAFATQVYGFSLPGQRSGGFSSSKINIDRRNSPFETGSSSGSRTPRTAPLPPDLDSTSHRASTGNMMAISPAPMSAPFFVSPSFRRSWGSPHPEFNLSSPPPPVPVASETPYVDPKGHIVPVISVLQSPQTATEDERKASAKHEKRKPSPINISRQLPLREENDHDNDLSMSGTSQAEALLSPRLEEFHMPAILQEDSSNNSFGLISPRAASFSIPAITQTQPVDSSSIFSPTVGEFPEDPFGHKGLDTYSDLGSPRSAEFHMTSLIPRQDEDDDLFGLTSPRATGFSKDPLAVLERSIAEDEMTHNGPHQRPHSILPPAGLGSLDGFGGFGALNAQPEAMPSLSRESNYGSKDSTPRPSESSQPSITVTSEQIRIDSLAPEDQHMDYEFSAKPDALPPTPPPTHSSSHLTTPSKQPSLQTKFSSPNMRDQLRLHKLQTEMEAMLPHRSPSLNPVADDADDALMSPRATEFTKNPFHVDLSTETECSMLDDREKTVLAEPNQNPTDWATAKPLEEDPRSPVQAGGSPIIRNIWDVL